MNITKNKTSVNAKKVYKRKKLTFFSDDLLAAIKKKVISPETSKYWKDGLCFVEYGNDDAAHDIGCCDAGQASYAFRSLERKGKIIRKYITNGKLSDTERLYPTQKKWVALDRDTSVKLWQAEKARKQRQKLIEQTNSQAIIIKPNKQEDYLNKLTSDEVVFRKNNDSKGALGFNLLLKNGIVVPIERQTFCFIVKLCLILARGLSTEIAIQRLREYINWLILRLKAVKYDDVFNFKNVYKFYFIARKRWQAEEREARLLEEHAERRLLNDRKREYQYKPFSAISNAVGCIADGLLQRFSMMRMLQ